MHCIFCEQNVLSQTKIKGQPTTLSGKGVAHETCAHNDMMQNGEFQGMRLADLSMEELRELNELLSTEFQKRQSNSTAEPH